MPVTRRPSCGSSPERGRSSSGASAPFHRSCRCRWSSRQGSRLFLSTRQVAHFPQRRIALGRRRRRLDAAQLRGGALLERQGIIAMRCGRESAAAGPCAANSRCKVRRALGCGGAEQLYCFSSSLGSACRRQPLVRLRMQAGRPAAALPPFAGPSARRRVALDSPLDLTNVDLCKARDICVALKKPGMKGMHALQEPSDSPACRRATVRVHCCRCLGRPSVGGGHAANRGHALVLGRASLLLLPPGCLPLLHLPNVLCSWMRRKRGVWLVSLPASWQ